MDSYFFSRRAFFLPVSILEYISLGIATFSNPTGWKCGIKTDWAMLDKARVCTRLIASLVWRNMKVWSIFYTSLLTMSFHEPGCIVHSVPQKNQQWCQDSPQDVPIQGKYWLQGLNLPSRRDKKADRTPVTSLIFPQPFFLDSLHLHGFDLPR